MNYWHDSAGRLRSFWRFLLGLVVGFVANFIAIGIAVSLSHRSNRILESVYRPLTMILLIVGYALLLMSADRRQERLLAAMGLGRSPRWLRHTLLGIALGATLVVVAVVFMGFFGELKFTTTVSARTISIALAELFILGTAAMGEELIFRSYPFFRLVEAAGPLVAIVVMSLLFGFAHGGNPHASTLALVNTCLIGALLCVAVLRTGSLWMAWGIHFAWNTALGLVFGLPVSGLTDFAVMVRTRAAGARWMTGGSYGIEGSWLGTLVIAAGFIPVILLTRSGPVSQQIYAQQGSATGDEPAFDPTLAPPGSERHPDIEEHTASDRQQHGRIQEY